MVAEHLALSNCAYADMDPDQDGFTIRGDWAAPGSLSIRGRYSLAAFGRLAVANLRAGEPLVLKDIESHLRDLDMVLPWARLVFGNAVPHPTINPEPASSSTEIAHLFLTLPTLADMPDRCETAIDELTALRARVANDNPLKSDASTRIDALIDSLAGSAAASRALVRRLSTLSELSQALFDAMEFDFLFDPTRKLFSIGYRLSDGRLDSGYYDLLASEARLASYIAISSGEVPVSHWFRLGRALTPIGNGSALVSWSGSMFEYLMPDLVLRAPVGSLLEQTSRLIVQRQIRHGEKRKVPWGISESAYALTDRAGNYQYRAFGAPG